MQSRKKDGAPATTIYDKTPSTGQGSYVFGRIVAVDLGNAVPPLAGQVCVAAACDASARGRESDAGASRRGPVTIVLVGDSTVAVGGGWGPGFCATVTPNVTCIDDARNGRSTKSFIDEGAWKKALDEKGDYYLIQFGHNDQEDPAAALHTDPDTTSQHREPAAATSRSVRAIGAVPVLVTSLSRRTYKDGVLVEDLTPYVQAAMMVAAEEYITLIDLNAMSVAMLKRMTQAEADTPRQRHRSRYRQGSNSGGGLSDRRSTLALAARGGTVPLDRTHLNPHGQKVFGRIVADSIVRARSNLGPISSACQPARLWQQAPLESIDARFKNSVLILHDVLSSPHQPCPHCPMGCRSSKPRNCHCHGASATAPVPPTPAKPLVFDIVSIRQNMSTQRNGPPKFGPTADGYHMTGAPLLLPIISAYIPQSAGTVAFMPNQIKGLPDWVMRDGYDLDAKVAEEDMAEWQKPASQKTMLPAMMQALLEDRCKMVAHRETKDSSVYLLTVGKAGPKFKETSIRPWNTRTG